MGVREDPVDGLLVPIVQAITPDCLGFFSGAGTAPRAKYTSSPRPGVWVPEADQQHLQLRMHGAQTYDALAMVLRPGVPQLGSGCSIAYRTDDEELDEDDDDYRKWSPPNMLFGWNAPVFSGTGDASYYAAVTHTETQQVALICSQGTAFTGNPHTGAWTAATLSGDSWGIDDQVIGLAMCERPDGRLIAVYMSTGTGSLNQEYSDDVGATWSFGGIARTPPTVGTQTYGRARMVYHRGDLLYFARQTTTSGDLHQVVSSDDGASWTLIEDTGAIMESTRTEAGPSVVVVGERILVAYLRTSDAYPVLRVLASASSPITDADEIEINGAAAWGVELCVDPDGLLWAYVRMSEYEIALFVSYDAGDTWAECEQGVWASGVGGDDYLQNLYALPVMGAVWLLHQWADTTDGRDPGSIGCMRLGGWSNLAAVRRSSTEVDPILEHVSGFGNHADADGIIWIPIELPDQNGWTRTAAGGTRVLGVPGELSVTTTVGTSEYYTRALGTEMEALCLIQVSRAARGANGTTEIGARLEVADGAGSYAVDVCIGSTNVEFINVHGPSSLGSVTLATDTEIQILIEIRSPNTVRIWTRTGISWTLRADAVLSNGGAGAATGSIAWGHIAAAGGTNDSDWQIVAVREMARIEQDLLDADVTAGYRPFSRPLSPLPIPVPGLASYTAGEPAAWISAVGGPAKHDELYRCRARSDHPWDALFADAEPSPDVTFRSVDKATLSILFDLGAETLAGNCVALFLANHNFNAANLDSYNGATWDTEHGISTAIGEGATNPSYQLEGDCIRPYSTGAVDRYIAEGELVGGYARIKAGGGGSEMRPILWNSAGWWSSTANVQVECRIEIDGTEDATGTVDLIPPTCIAVVTTVTNPRARYWRLRILSSAISYEAYREIGLAMLCRVVPFGAECTWGSQHEARGNVALRTSRYGTTRARDQGPVQVAWRLAMSEPGSYHHIRSGDEDDPDYRGYGSEPGLIAVEDTALLLRGVLEATKGGRYPVVAVAQLPTGDAILTDRSLWCYGRMLGPIVATHDAGELGRNETFRLDQVSIEPIT